MFLSRLSAAVTQYPTQALKSLLVHFVCSLQSFIEFFTFLSFIFWSNLIHPGIVFKPYLIRHDVNALNSFAMLLTWKLRLTCDADPYSVYLCFCAENPFRLIFNSESNALFHVVCVVPNLIISLGYWFHVIITAYVPVHHFDAHFIWNWLLSWGPIHLKYQAMVYVEDIRHG